MDCVGGKVLPQWTDEPPAWLTREQWSPLALVDYGDAPFFVNAENRLCLETANAAFRRAVFDRIGLFSPELQRVRDSIGSMEDLELMMRFWHAGGQGLYLPDIVVTAPVQIERLTKAYHRRWHTGHGHFYAMMRAEEIEGSQARLFDVPGHLYRQALRDTAEWLRCTLAGERHEAFRYETQLRFFLGFFRKRRGDFLETNHGGTVREIATFIRRLATRKGYNNTQKEII